MDEVRVFDLHRMFLGDLPWTFTLEIALRTTVLYLYALLLMRLVGKRGIGSLSPFEWVIVIALGSAVGDPMFYADVPLLHGMVVLTMIVGLQRGLVHLTQHNERLETFVESVPRCLVLEGRINLDSLKKEDLSREELFAALRQRGVAHLGEVARAYLEPSGHVSVILRIPREIGAGLSVLPRSTEESPSPTVSAGTPAPRKGEFACPTCGEIVSSERDVLLPRCPRCQGNQWVAPKTKEQAGYHSG
jgi:uncharacterized membrane protein YcaP (DUF421 family)